LIAPNDGFDCLVFKCFYDLKLILHVKERFKYQDNISIFKAKVETGKMDHTGEECKRISISMGENQYLFPFDDNTVIEILTGHRRKGPVCFTEKTVAKVTGKELIRLLVSKK